MAETNDLWDRIKEPEIPQEILNAAEYGKLIIFVGNGISRLCKCPSWAELADGVLNDLAEKQIISYAVVQRLTPLDAKKKLSIAKEIAKGSNYEIPYETIIEGNHGNSDIYKYLNSVNAIYVTTNYDRLLKPDSHSDNSSTSTVSTARRFYKKDEINSSSLSTSGNVIHLHGCLDDTAGMILTTEDYLRQYEYKDDNNITDFLKLLFTTRVVLFVGYGLAESEILEFILRKKGLEKDKPSILKRFMLEGFFSHDKILFECLHKYYKENFNVHLIPFELDALYYNKLEQIFNKWSLELRSKLQPPSVLRLLTDIEETIKNG